MPEESKACVVLCRSELVGSRGRGSVVAEWSQEGEVLLLCLGEGGG